MSNGTPYAPPENTRFGPITVSRQGGRWFAHCAGVGVTVQADDLEQLGVRLGEALATEDSRRPKPGGAAGSTVERITT